MPAQPGTLESLARELGRAFAPLKDRLAGDQARLLLAELGLRIPGATPLPAGLIAALADAAAVAAELPPLIAELEQAVTDEDLGALVATGVALTQKVVTLVTRLEALGNALGAAAGSLPGMQPADVLALAGELAGRLAEWALLTYLEGYWPKVSAFLRLTGLLDYTQDPGRPGDPTRPPHVIKALRLDRLADLLADPEAHFIAIYAWGSPAFDARRFLEVVNAMLFGFAIPSTLEDVGAGPLKQLKIAPFRLVPEPPGLSLRFDANLGSNLALELPFLGPHWKLGIAVRGALDESTGLRFTPPANVAFVPPGGAGFQLRLEHRPPQPIRILAIGEGSRVQLDAFSAHAGVDVTAAAGAELELGADLIGGKVLIDTSGSDGFLQQLMSGIHLEASFDVGVAYSTRDGLHFHGSGALEIQLASHLSLGPIELTALTLSVGIEGAAFPVGISTNLKAALGPLTAVVEDIGLEVAFSLAGDHKGNLGPLDARPGFHPPRGVGLAINAGVVVGGGYLFFDPAKGEYAGVAELSIAELVTVKAIGLITTRMPDGSDGFSLLLIITTEFSPIQLGFGFTLNGVGGLLGANRAVRLDVLREGVRTGAIDSLLFPTNVIANAPRILSDLAAVFPPEEGTFLIGPMAKLGWGTPSLITLSLGLIIEIPPGNIAILGVLKVALPDADHALILIQVNFVGTLDLEEQLLTFDASLFQSRVLFITLEGDMAVRLKWGDDAGFLLSVGGFHPSFTPPPGLHLPGSLKRLTISILDTSWARIRAEGYFAVTSNTVQFGAHLFLFFGVDGANINGELGFDVLFQLSPFHFVALLSGSLAIEVFGADLMSIRLRFSLEGPTPWRAQGTGSISILFFSIDVDFDVTWGEHKDTALPPVSVMPIFVAELEKRDSWRALPPPSGSLLVSLRQLDPALLVLHPFGALTVSQRALPLELTLDKVGNQQPDDVNRVDITEARSGGVALPLADAGEQFAAAQYQAMTDAEKLSRPSYQRMKGGVTVGAGDDARSSRVTRRTIVHDVFIDDVEPPRPLPFRRFRAEAATLFRRFLAGGAVGRSPLSAHQRQQLQPHADKITVGAAAYAVAGVDDNRPADAAARFSSEALARDDLRRRIAADPALEGTLHVLPEHEVNAA